MEHTPHVVLCMAELSFCLLLITDLILCVHTHIYESMCMCVHVHMYICLSERLCMPDTERERESERERKCVCVRARDTTTMTTKYLTSIAQINKNNCISFHNAVQYYNSSIIILLKVTL